MKLLAFTLAMIVVPIGSYFLTVDSFFQGSVIRSLVSSHFRRSGGNGILRIDWQTKLTVGAGNSTYAGALAAVMANAVLIGYIVVAMAEDQTDQETAKEGKKDR